MPGRDVLIKFNAETGTYIAEVHKAVQSHERLNNVLNQGTQQSGKAAQSYAIFNDATGRLAVSQRNAGTAVQILIGQLGAVGQVGNLAANAISTMTLASGPAGIALGVLAASMGFLTYRISQAKERLAELAEIQLAEIGREQKNLSAENTLKRRIEILQAAKPDIAEITQRFGLLRLELEKSGARPQALAAVDTLKNLELGAAAKKQNEEATKAVTTARESIESQIEAVRAQAIALTEGEKAATLYGIANLSTSEAVKKLGAEGDVLLKLLRDEKLALLEANQALEQRAALAKFIAESGSALDIQQAEAREKARQAIEAEFALKERVLDLDVMRLRASGLQDAADKLELENLINLNNQRKSALENANINRVPGELAGIQHSTDVARIKLQQLGQTSIDIAGEVSRVVTDITGAVIAGTLKWADIGKSVLASFVRLALEQFTGFLRTMQDSARATQMLSAGAIVPGAGQSGIGGGGFNFSGILDSIGNFFGGGSSGGGGFLSSITSLFGGGSGGGGILSSIGNAVSGFGSAIGGLLGGGASAGWSSGFDIADAGGFLGPTAAGGGVLAGLSNFLPGIGGLVGGMLGGTKGPLGIGGGILGSIGGTVLGSSLSLLAGGTGGILASLLPALTPLLSNPITAIIAAIVVAITSIFGAQKVNPTVRVQAQVEGILYDALANQFKAGGVSTKAQGQDIPGSVVKQVKTQVQEILEQQSKVWTDILNIFPKVIHDDMIPALDHANQLLNKMFANLKFSEGGSRSIAEEIKALATREAPGKFFIALRGVIGAGLTSAFDRAGLDLGGSVGSSFGELPLSTRTNINKYTYPGLNVPKKAKDMEDFLKAITEFAALSGGLANISSGGVKPFLTEADLATLQTQIDTVLQITDGAKFAKGFEQMQERIKPVVEFLQQSVQQATDIFGRGLIAALDAATESEANAAFLANLGEGVKDIIFQGITSAFVASAQFNDLLAPIQKTIREFTEQAVATGETPDLAAFRAAIMPGIEDITTRAETLAPLIAELQKLGLDVKDALGLVAEVTATAKGAEININIAEFTGTEADVRELAGRLDEFLTPLLNP